MAEVKDRLRRGLSRWASGHEQEAQALRRDVAQTGCCPIAEVTDRQRADITGSLRTVTLRPRGGVPALEAELYDGSGVLTVIWLGRRRISGIQPGRQIRVEGRVGIRDSHPLMFNPRYELR